MNKNSKSLNTYFIVILILLGLTYFISTLGEREDVFTKAELTRALDENVITRVEIQPNKETPTGVVRVTLTDGRDRVVYVSDVKEIEQLLSDYQISPIMRDVPKESWFMTYMLPMLVVLIIGVFFFVMMNSQNSGGNGKMMNFGKSRAKLSLGEGNITLKDVAWL